MNILGDYWAARLNLDYPAEWMAREFAEHEQRRLRILRKRLAEQWEEAEERDSDEA